MQPLQTQTDCGIIVCSCWWLSAHPHDVHEFVVSEMSFISQHSAVATMTMIPLADNLIQTSSTKTQLTSTLTPRNNFSTTKCVCKRQSQQSCSALLQKPDCSPRIKSQLGQTPKRIVMLAPQIGTPKPTRHSRIAQIRHSGNNSRNETAAQMSGKKTVIKVCPNAHCACLDVPQNWVSKPVLSENKNEFCQPKKNIQEESLKDMLPTPMTPRNQRK